MTAPMAAVRAAELLKLKTTHFVLWRPGITHPVPRLVIGTFQSGNPPTLANLQFLNLVELASQSDLWGIPAKECQLANDTVYHYWFEVMNSHPVHHEPSSLFCTDPTAWTVDWRILSPFGQNGEARDLDRYPAGVVLYRNEQLELCDPGKEQIDWDGDPPLDQLPKNNQLIIYELPTRWARQNIEGGIEIDVGTFRDVIALIDLNAPPANFIDIQALEQGHAHISELGANALELLPPADSFLDREWGYATSNYFAADYDLGLPERFQSSTASTDLAHLVKTCHQYRMRFFDDMVMAFATRSPYHTINYLDFFVLLGSGDPEEVVDGYKRDGFGGNLFKFNYQVDSYDPETGRSGRLFPARQFLYTHLKH